MGYNKGGGKKQYNRDNRLQGMSVKVFDNNIEKALRKLKKMVKESKLLVELKDRQFFIKKSEKKRNKRKKNRE
jgi:ribosomal protein S21